MRKGRNRIVDAWGALQRNTRVCPSITMTGHELASPLELRFCLIPRIAAENDHAGISVRSTKAQISVDSFALKRFGLLHGCTEVCCHRSSRNLRCFGVELSRVGRIPSTSGSQRVRTQRPTSRAYGQSRRQQHIGHDHPQACYRGSARAVVGILNEKHLLSRSPGTGRTGSRTDYRQSTDPRDRRLELQMSDYSSKYSDDGFWSTIRKAAKSAGVAVLRPAFELYYSMESPDTPAWAKTVAVGALGYLVFPIDAVPDFLPVVGFSDDVLTMAAAIGSLGRYVTIDIKNKAKVKAEEWLS